jgi:magnesium-transporting ATPase (P-type)
LVIGILDQFISARLLDRYPQLYSIGQENQFFKIRVFTNWIINAFYHSLILYIGSELFYYGDNILNDGTTAGHWVWGTALYGAVLATVLGKAGLITNNWTKYHVIAIPGSMALWIVFIAVYAYVAPKLDISTEYAGLVPKLFTSPVFYIQLVVLPCVCLLRDYAWKYAKRMYRPQTYHHIQEIQKYNIQDYRPRYVALPVTSSVASCLLTIFIEWSNSRRLLERCARCRECASSVDMHSRKQTRVRRALSTHMIPREAVAGMERCKPHPRDDDNVLTCTKFTASLVFGAGFDNS